MPTKPAREWPRHSTRHRRGLGRAYEIARAALAGLFPRGPCWICGCEGSWTDPADPLTADHVTPRSLGGGADLRPAHMSCNRRRGAS